MKKVLIKLLSFLITLSTVCCLSGCDMGKKELSYYSYDSNATEMNKSLFYQNSSNEWGADPSILYCDEGEYAGNYFIYCTSGNINTAGIQVWMSKNLTDWKIMGNAFMPDVDSYWCYKGFWAPQCIYDKEYGKYYMFYSAPWGSDGTLRYDSCCVADSPVGPFREITSDTKTVGEPVLQFELHKDEFNPAYVSDQCGHYGINGFIKVIGPSPIIDPETGRRYLFFVSDLGTSGAEASGAYCIEMEDWATPKYETLKRITSFGYTNTDETKEITEGGSTNEGPMCFYKDGKYYLLFLTYTYFNSKYQSRGAVADEIMGPYEKFDIDNGAQIIYTEYNFQRQAVGIHGLTQAGDTLMAAYMTFRNNVNYDGTRKFAIDEVAWVENKDGTLTMQANGPSVTPQPLPEVISGYKNMSKYATITSDNTQGGSDVKYLYDGVIPYHANSLAPEYFAGDGTTTINYKFDDFVTLRSVMVYNSKDYDYMFNQIDSIKFHYSKNGEEGDVEIGPIEYNWDYYDFENNRPAIGSAMIAEFDELDVNNVEIKVTNPENINGIAIPEIVLLGKESDGSARNIGKVGALYDEYSFTNEPFEQDWSNVKNTKLVVDGEYSEEYGEPVYRLYAGNDTNSPNYADLYAYRNDEGVYLYVDSHDASVSYGADENLQDNTNIILMMADKNKGSVDKNCIAARMDVSGAVQRSIGVKSQKAWLRSWFTGSNAAKLHGGSIDDLQDCKGYGLELFVPYEQLGFKGPEDFTILRIFMGMHCIEDNGIIRRELSTSAKNGSQTDPTSWLKIDFTDHTGK